MSKDQKNIVSFTVTVLNTGEPDSQKEPLVMCKTSFRADSGYTDAIREHLSKELAKILKDYDVENDTPEIVTEDGTVAGVICWDTPDGLYEWKEDWESSIGTVKNQKVSLFVKENFKAAVDDGSDEDGMDDLSGDEEEEDEGEEDFDLPEEDEQGSEEAESEEAEAEADGDEEEEEAVKVKKPAARKRKAGDQGTPAKKGKSKKTKKNEDSEYSSEKEEAAAEAGGEKDEE